MVRATATFRIVKDYIGLGYDDRTLLLQRYETGPTHRVTLKDDDGIVYFTGVLKVANDSLDDATNLLYDWGIADTGTTQILIDGKLVIG